jgi:hypothetical protein
VPAVEEVRWGSERYATLKAWQVGNRIIICWDII